MHSLISNFGYHQVKVIFNEGYTFKYRLYRGLEISVLLLVIVRLSSLGLALKFHANHQLDPTFNFLRTHSQTYGIYSLSVGVLFCVHLMIIQKVAYFNSVDNVAAIGYYDLVVNATNIYQNCLKGKRQVRRMRRLKVKELRTRIVRCIGQLDRVDRWLSTDKLLDKLVKLWMTCNLDDVNKNKMAHHKLMLFSTLSTRVRVRLMQILIGLDYLIMFTFFTVAFFAIVWFILWIPLLSRGLPLLNCFLLIPDMSFVAMTVWLLYRNNAIVFHYAIITSEVYRLHANEWNQMLERTAKKGKLSPSHRITASDLSRLSYFVSEHTRMSQIISIINSQYVSNLLFALLLVNVPINIYHVYHALFKISSKTVHLAVTVIITITHFVGFAIALIPMARVSAAYHRPLQHMPSILSMMHLTDHSGLKLKVHEMYARLTNGPMIGNTIGPGVTITYMTLFQFLFIYIDYLFTIFEFLIDNFA